MNFREFISVFKDYASLPWLLMVLAVTRMWVQLMPACRRPGLSCMRPVHYSYADSLVKGRFVLWLCIDARIARCFKVGKRQPRISGCRMPLVWKDFEGLRLCGFGRWLILSKLSLKLCQRHRKRQYSWAVSILANNNAKLSNNAKTHTTMIQSTSIDLNWIDLNWIRSRKGSGLPGDP